MKEKTLAFVKVKFNPRKRGMKGAVLVATTIDDDGYRSINFDDFAPLIEDCRKENAA